MATLAVVRFSFIGFHRWPNAPKERFYLRAMHRHRFEVEAKVEVRHDDREIEFHDLLEFCRDRFEDGANYEGLSCEMMAERLVRLLADQYGFDRKIEVSVFEDGEVGALVVNHPQEVISS